MTEAVVPLVVVLWERSRSGQGPRNEFEERVTAVFDGFSSDEGDAMQVAVDAYRSLRGSGRAECFFNDCLATAAEAGPVEASWVAEALLQEGLKLAGQTFFKNSLGELGPGRARLWDNAVFRGPNGSGATIYQGPWPWLTAIGPDMSSYEEYGNVESFQLSPR